MDEVRIDARKSLALRRRYRNPRIGSTAPSDHTGTEGPTTSGDGLDPVAVASIERAATALGERERALAWRKPRVRKGRDTLRDAVPDWPVTRAGVHLASKRGEAAIAAAEPEAYASVIGAFGRHVAATLFDGDGFASVEAVEMHGLHPVVTNLALSAWRKEATLEAWLDAHAERRPGGWSRKGTRAEPRRPTMTVETHAGILSRLHALRSRLTRGEWTALDLMIGAHGPTETARSVASRLGLDSTTVSQAYRRAIRRIEGLVAEDERRRVADGFDQHLVIAVGDASHVVGDEALARDPNGIDATWAALAYGTRGEHDRRTAWLMDNMARSSLGWVLRKPSDK